MSIQHVIKVGSYDKHYIISESMGDQSQVAKWLSETVKPTEDFYFDFIGPVSLGNYRSVALTMGQSFKVPTRVLLIEKGLSSSSVEFIKALYEYSSTNQLEVTHIVETAPGEFKYSGGNVSLTFDFEVVETSGPENQVFEQLEASPVEHHLIKKTKHTWREMQEKLISGEILSARRLDWANESFVAFNKGSVLEADKFWIPANKKAAERNGGHLVVRPYYALCDGASVRFGWTPTDFEYHADDWVDASLNMFLVDLKRDRDGLVANYELLSGEFTNGANKLVAVYDLLDDKAPAKILCISADFNTTIVLSSLLTDMKKKRYFKDAFATTVLNLGDDRPYDSDLLTFDTLDITIAVSGDLIEKAANNTLDELEVLYKENTDLKLVIDLESFAKDPELAADDPAEVNERAVEYVNWLIRGLKARQVFKGLSWAVIDMEAEVAEEF